MIAHPQSSFRVSGEFDRHMRNWEDHGKLLNDLGVIMDVKDGTVDTCLMWMREGLCIFRITNHHSDMYAIRDRKR